MDSVKNTCVAGIDPGATGAVSFVFTAAPQIVTALDMPVADGRVCAPSLAAMFRQFSPDLVVIENVHAVRGNGVSSTWNFAVNHGVAIGVVGALQLPVRYVAPTKWKKYFGLAADKELSRARALETWPACADAFSRKKDHGRAESALIALYGRIHFVQEVAAHDPES